MTDILINSWTKGVLESVGADRTERGIAAREIGRLSNRMLSLAPVAGLRVEIKIMPALPLSDSLNNGGSSK